MPGPTTGLTASPLPPSGQVPPPLLSLIEPASFIDILLSFNNQAPNVTGPDIPGSATSGAQNLFGLNSGRPADS